MEPYKIIYADPPWQYDVWSRSKKFGTADIHYNTMSIEEISALDVNGITDKDCALFLWTTFPKLEEAFKVIEAWGFTYKTVGFVWVKQNRKSPSLYLGMGFWTRANAEVCLFATKGKPKRMSASVRQVILSPVRRHSQKPDEARERIVELLGDLPRIELFARDASEGWDVWGNEVENDIELIAEEGGDAIGFR